MPLVVPVKFPYASRDLWFDPEGLDIVMGDYAICCTERGTEIGLVTGDPFDVPVAELAAPLKSVIRIADDTDLDRADELADRGEDAMHEFRRLSVKNGLDIKPVGVEFLFGGEKAVFYFAAEDRVDFRQLVRDLSSVFHVRVDMRQIGVRDETRLAGGYATCGQELCCTRFGGQFEPVSIRMAKEQDLPLNSAKISGVCGRLMCCLRYEFDAYKDFKSRAPKKKTLIDTPLGKARIMEYNTPREQLVLRLESGKVFRVNLSDMTCTDGCKKKAAEQGCSCRPDCVTRDVLERIESPEMKLALMELDRQNGVDVGDGLDKSDRIVTSGPTRSRKGREDAARRASDEAPAEGGRRRRRRAGDGSAEQGTPSRRLGSGQAPAGDAESAGRRRRRRAGDAAADGGTCVADAAGSDTQAASAPGRRRRRHLSNDERDDAFRAAAARSAQGGQAAGSDAPAGEKPGRSRRRHSAVPAAGGKPDTRSVAQQVSEGEVKVTRRRPGDGGGAQAAPDADLSAPDAAKKRRRRRTRKPKDTDIE